MDSDCGAKTSEHWIQCQTGACKARHMFQLQKEGSGIQIFQILLILTVPELQFHLVRTSFDASRTEAGEMSFVQLHGIH